MAAIPVLRLIGMENTVDGDVTPLSAKLNFACGTPEFLQTAMPILRYGDRPPA